MIPADIRLACYPGPLPDRRGIPAIDGQWVGVELRLGAV
jgi:hypothetical protein